MTGQHLHGAPPAPPAEPAERPTRPDSIRLAVQLWVAVIVCLIVERIADYGVISDEVKKAAKDLPKTSDGKQVFENLDALVVVVFVLTIVVLTVIAAVLMWAAWSGFGWGRALLGGVSAFVVVQLVFSVIALFVGDSDLGPAWGMVPTILGGVCAVGALTALMHRDSADYCREVAAYRTRNRHNGVR